MRYFPALSVAAILSAIGVNPVQAALVKYEFTATVSTIVEQAHGSDVFDHVNSSVVAGRKISTSDTWTGTFVYDTELALSRWQPTPPAVGTHSMFEGYLAATISDRETGLSFHSSPNLFSLMSVRNSPNNAGSDYISINTHVFGADYESSSFWFHDLTGNALSSATPPSNLNLEDFKFTRVSYSFLRGIDDYWMSAEAVLTSLTRVGDNTSVPEPATYVLLWLGLVALVITKRNYSN
jgi:hypothetical protein